MRIASVVGAWLALWLGAACGASVLAIDYGTDSVKASLVKPGLPFDVLINRDSKRKTPSLVAIRDEERLLGSAGESLKTRFPSDVFASLKLLVGGVVVVESPQSSLHRSLFSNDVRTDSETGALTLANKKGKRDTYRLEELIANEFQFVKELAEQTAAERVREAVVSVPAWFSIAQRQTIVDALDLAGMSTLALVNDGSAAAVNYAMSRSFPPTFSNHLFYDFGAGSVRATVVSLRSAMVPDLESLAAKPTLKNATTVDVKGYGYDLEMGGYVFDKVIRDLLVAKFESDNAGIRVSKNERAMAKLLKEASRVKHVLSANNEATARIEGLVDDIDMRVSVTRQEFEDSLKNDVNRFTQPIVDALSAANLTMSDIASVVMVGGSSRVPMVETAVASMVGEDKVAKNVNADEAVVLGSALYGATVTPGFRTKDIRLQDLSLYAIDASYEADALASGEATTAAPRRITTHLFPARSKLGTKKTMTFKKLSDFSLRFSYRPSAAPAGGDGDIFEVAFKGIDKAVANATQESLQNATVKVTVELDELTMLNVGKAVLSLGGDDDADETAGPSLNDRLKGLLGKIGGGSSKSKAKSSKGKKGGDSGDDQQAEDAGDDSDEVKQDDISKDDEKETQAEIDRLLRKMNSTVTLTSSRSPLGSAYRPLSSDERVSLKKRLQEAKAAETRKLAREEARNTLEAFIYRARDVVSNDAAFAGASTDSERRTIADKVASAHEWLSSGEADEAPTKDLKSRKADLEKLVKHVQARASEASYRPTLVRSFESSVSAAVDWLKSALEENASAVKEGVLARWTSDELDAFDKLVRDARAWFDETRKRQDALKAFEDVVLRRSDVEKKVAEFEKELDKLKRKKKPRRSTSKSKSASTSSSSAGEEETGKPRSDHEDKAEEEKREHIKDEL